MTSVLPNLELEPATSQKHSNLPTSGLGLGPFYSGLELDSFYSGLEVNRNVSGLEPLSINYGPEPTPAERHEQIGAQVLIATEEKEAVEGESPDGLIVDPPNEDLPRTKSWHRLVVALIFFVVLVAIIVSVSVTQTRSSSR